MPVTVDMGSRDVTIAPAQARGVVVREGPQGIQGERGPTGVQGPPGDLTKEVADATYERKLIDTAVWRVDAGALSADGLSLLDLSGNDRPAVFGAGAAKPVVLPYDGEPYLYIPQRTDSAGDSINSNLRAVPCDVMQATIRGDILLSASGTRQFLQVGDGTNGWLLTCNTSGLFSRRFGAATLNVAFPAGAPTKQWNRFTHTTATGDTVWEESDDGAVWTTRATVNHGTCVQSSKSSVYLGGGTAAYSAGGTRHYVGIVIDGALVHEMLPKNVNTSTYTTIANTGSAGGDWTISRAATGYKTVVVDRPLLLFGGTQYAEAVSGVQSGTILMAARVFKGSVSSTLFAGSTNLGVYQFLSNTGGLTSIARTASGDQTTRADTSMADGRRTFGATLAPALFQTVRDGAARATDTTVASGTALTGPLLQIGRRGAGSYFEFEAMAVFDRVLGADELAAVSEELAGIAHRDATNPHPQYAAAADLVALDARVDALENPSGEGTPEGGGAALVTVAGDSSGSVVWDGGPGVRFKRRSLPPILQWNAADGSANIQAASDDFAPIQVRDGGQVVWRGGNHGFNYWSAPAGTLTTADTGLVWEQGAERITLLDVSGGTAAWSRRHTADATAESSSAAPAGTWTRTGSTDVVFDAAPTAAQGYWADTVTESQESWRTGRWEKVRFRTRQDCPSWLEVVLRTQVLRRKVLPADCSPMLTLHSVWTIDSGMPGVVIIDVAAELHQPLTITQWSGVQVSWAGGASGQLAVVGMKPGHKLATWITEPGYTPCSLADWADPGAPPAAGLLRNPEVGGVAGGILAAGIDRAALNVAIQTNASHKMYPIAYGTPQPQQSGTVWVRGFRSVTTEASDRHLHVVTDPATGITRWWLMAGSTGQTGHPYLGALLGRRLTKTAGTASLSPMVTAAGVRVDTPGWAEGTVDVS